MLKKEIEQYITSHTTKEDDILFELNRETHIKAINPRMLSGHPQGKLLELISKVIAPENILEIGTYTGYSGICLARGLKEGGMLHTIERNDELASIQDKYFQKSGLKKCIKRHTGDAMEIIPRLNILFDLVFIDADKKHYPDFFNLVINKIKKGGVILADNVLWDGKVVDDTSNDPDTFAIKEFNKKVANDKRVEATILPLRDGISIIRKL